MSEDSPSRAQSGVTIVRRFSSPDPDDLARRLQFVFTPWMVETGLDSNARIQSNRLEEKSDEKRRRLDPRLNGKTARRN